MAHCGYEATAVTDTFTRPLKALGIAIKGVETEAKMAPEIELSKARPAEYVFERRVQEAVEQLHAPKLNGNSEEAA